MRTSLLVLVLALATAPAAAQICPGFEQAKLVSFDAADSDRAGTAVAIDGDTALVGAPYDDDLGARSGSVYVWQRDGTVWSFQAKLLAFDGAKNDRFGSAVALEGDRALVGVIQDAGVGCCTGSVRVFERSGTDWTEMATLTASDGGPHDNFGSAVAISGDLALIGAPEDPGAGSAYFFQGAGSTWTEELKVTASNGVPNHRFGLSVSLSGNRGLVGSYDDGAYVFEPSGTTWVEDTVLLPATPLPWDSAGHSVSLSGDRALVGTPNFQTTDPGRVLVFERSGTSWNEVASLQPVTPGLFDHFGIAVSLNGDTAIVGAPQDESSEGAAFVFRASVSGWYEDPKIEASDGQILDRFGGAVAISDDTAIVGAMQADSTVPDTGAAYIYATLPQTGSTYCTAGTSASGCQALITALGVPSASAPSGFCLSVRDVEGGKDGLFFYGPNGKQANSWGNGTSYVCVVPPRLRGGLLVAFGSTAGACDGWFTQDLNARWCATCPKPAHNYGAGATLQAQFWYRDPQSTSNQTSSMSDAVEFSMQP